MDSKEVSQDDGKKIIRLHVKGLPAKMSEKDVEDRFKSFGQVHSVDLIPHPFEEGSCRGFAYLNIETNQAALSKCMNVLNGCAWKGGKLQISMAKANRFVRLEDGQVSIAPRNGNSEKTSGKRRRLGERRKRKLTRLASDQSLVNDKNVDNRKGWRRGRYGRAIACLRIRRPNRQLLIVDPSHYKNSLEKLFGSVKPRPLSKLTWTITDIIEEKKEKKKKELAESDHEMDLKEEIFKEVEEFEGGQVEHVEHVEIVEIVENEECIEAVQNDNSEITDREVGNEERASELIESIYQEISNDNFEIEASPSYVPDVSVVDDSTLINATQNNASSQSQNSPSDLQPVEEESKFEVNVNWNNLFNPDCGKELFKSDNQNSIFTLGSLLEKTASKVKLVPTEELFLKPPSMPSSVEETESEVFVEVPETAKKVHNFAGIFADLNRITPTNATRFGMLLSRKDDILAEWRIERYDFKEDFKKRLSEGKRRNRKAGPNSGASKVSDV